jgi:hypothetical protein
MRVTCAGGARFARRVRAPVRARDLATTKNDTQRTRRRITAVDRVSRQSRTVVGSRLAHRNPSRYGRGRRRRRTSPWGLRRPVLDQRRCAKASSKTLERRTGNQATGRSRKRLPRLPFIDLVQCPADAHLVRRAAVHTSPRGAATAHSRSLFSIRPSARSEEQVREWPAGRRCLPLQQANTACRIQRREMRS